MAFHKRRILTIEDMTDGDRWLYRELRNFRAGIEAGISYLKLRINYKQLPAELCKISTFWTGTS